MSRIWKIEPLARPSAAHAADAVEIVDGEAVRRVTLPEMDLEVYRLYQSFADRLRRAPHARELAQSCKTASVEEIEAALRRLTAAGLIAAEQTTTLQ